MKSDYADKSMNRYDDGDIPKVDLQKDNVPNDADYMEMPLPETSRPRKDGPGGD